MFETENPCEAQVSNWDDIAKWLNQFPAPEVTVNVDEGGTSIAKTAWAFRGLRDSSYKLAPTIEREASSKSIGWPALELLVSQEFRSRARMHLSAPIVPEDELGWRAVMQHYGVPSRLLDFTYSLFVGLYFAVRGGLGPASNESQPGCLTRPSIDRTHVRLWAVNTEALMARFKSVAHKARNEERKRQGTATARRVNLFDPAYSESDRDLMADETEEVQKLIVESLSAKNTQREEQNRQGCVCAAVPPTLNPRLSSQQGIFLLNCAEGLTFIESMEKMMQGVKNSCEKLDIPVNLLPELENKLFQMNINEQSLFPDLEGMAGLIRQKIRLHWNPTA